MYLSGFQFSFSKRKWLSLIMLISGIYDIVNSCLTVFKFYFLKDLLGIFLILFVVLFF